MSNQGKHRMSNLCSMSSAGLPRVMVACPDARPPAYQAVVGLARAQLLHSFSTAYYYGGGGALAALGRGTAVAAERPWQRRLDALIDVVVAIPALLVAVPLELAAATLHHGGAVSLSLKLL